MKFVEPLLWYALRTGGLAVCEDLQMKKGLTALFYCPKKGPLARAYWRWGGGGASLFFLGGLLCSLECFRRRRALAARLAHFLFRACLDPFPLRVDVRVQTFRHHDLLDFLPLHFQRFRDNRSGLLGFFAAFGDRFIWPALRAQ